MLDRTQWSLFVLPYHPLVVVVHLIDDPMEYSLEVSCCVRPSSDAAVEVDITIHRCVLDNASTPMLYQNSHMLIRCNHPSDGSDRSACTSPVSVDLFSSIYSPIFVLFILLYSYDLLELV